ncbi:MAG: GntR family transcriptional regulator [Planctomycetota bacterium]|nr:GntR family transcriptional regulator [Planctomycetota bacterium]
MRIYLDHHRGEPIYRQIVEAVKLLIARGELAEGTKLPSIRELASQLKINTRTVVKAYETLDGAGLAVMQHGRGVFVTAPQSVLPARERRKVLSELAQRLLAEATRIGATPDEVVEIVQAAAQDMVTKR